MLFELENRQYLPWQIKSRLPEPRRTAGQALEERIYPVYAARDAPVQSQNRVIASAWERVDSLAVPVAGWALRVPEVPTGLIYKWIATNVDGKL